MTLRSVGFFREFRGGIGESVEQMPVAPVDRRVVDYLRSGTVLVAVPGLIMHPGTTRPLCAAHIRTDGVWVWPEELAHLVLARSLSLPADLSFRWRSRLGARGPSHEKNWRTSRRK
jgi:hypothetical protein